jgi:hypothetical protein
VRLHKALFRSLVGARIDVGPRSHLALHVKVIIFSFRFHGINDWKRPDDGRFRVVVR